MSQTPLIESILPDIQLHDIFKALYSSERHAEARWQRYTLITTLCSYVHLYLGQRIQSTRLWPSPQYSFEKSLNQPLPDRDSLELNVLSFT